MSHNLNTFPIYRGRRVLRTAVGVYADFNPLPLYRGRPSSISGCPDLNTFQSTSSIQRKTSMLFDSLFIISISIHFLYTKEDLASYNGIADPNNFNLLPLYRGRRPRLCPQCYPTPISIHFLYTEEDRLDSLPPVTLSRFQSTSSIQRKTWLGNQSY